MNNETVITSLKEKIDDLNQQAWEARVNDSPKAFELSSESVKLSREINYPKGLAEGLRSLGFCYVRLFKNDEAEPLLRESLSLFKSLNDLSGQAVIYEYLGIIERNWGNLGHSLELLLKGNELVRQVGPADVEVTCCYQIGVTYKHLGDHENALDYLYRSLSLAEKIKMTLMEAYATNIIGSIYFDNGNYQKALELYQQGLVIRRQSNDKWGEAGSLDNIGITYLKLNQLDKAIDYCKQSLVISQSTGDKKGEANALLHLAEIYEQANDIQQASKFSNESLAIRKARGDKRGEAEVLLFLAGLYKNGDDNEKQEIYEWLSGALKIADEIKAQDLLSKAFYDLHEFYIQKGDFKKSLAHLESHLHIEKELHKNTINQKVANLEISHKAEAISQQNKELTELNEQIEKANAELKVESSLERVRTTAMAMKEPDDMLEICKIISHELSLLNVKEIRNIQTAIFYEEKGSYMNYEYYAKHDKTFITDVDYNDHEVAKKFATQMLKGPNQVWVHGFSGEEVKNWLKYQRTTNVFIDNFLETADSLNYYWHSLGPVALGISTYSPLSEEQVDLFKRFRNVFELAYRRYLDIEKALEQAREAQIEAGLERVRARGMAMHKSDELKEVIRVVFEQLVHLNIHVEHAGFIIDYKDRDDMNIWLADKNEVPFQVTIPYFDCAHWNSFIDAKRKGNDFFANHLSFEEKNKFYQDLFKLIPGVPEETLKYYLTCPGLAISTVLLDNVGLYIENFSGTPYTDEENNILMRFGKVFQQTYTRFLDLQKAEAQAKEAQIETALERIRARAMAMHSSDEIIEVANILREQMGLLNQPDLETSVVNLLDEDPQNVHSWHAFRQPGTSGIVISGTLSFPKNSGEMVKEMLALYNEGRKEYTIEASGQKLKDFTKVLITAEPEIAKYTGEHLPEKVFYHFATFKGGTLLTVSYQPPTDDVKSLQRRAASVFDMAYRRYLDLKKAEGQAREAQIETGLERVRSKTMAMHKSEEVTGVAVTLNAELLKLGFKGGSTIIIINKETGDTEQWTGFSEDKTLKSCFVPYFKHAFNDALLDAWKKGEKFFVYTIEGDEKISLDEHYFSTGYKIFPENDKKWMRAMKSVTFSHAFIKYGAIHWGPNHLTDEELRILQRFANVFEQTYTRFLDLQKAEAQAREARIAAAVERVRATSLAMHKSDELHNVVNILFESLRELLLQKIDSVNINIMHEDSKDFDLWIAAPSQDYPSNFRIPYYDHPITNDFFSAVKKGTELHQVTYPFDVKNRYFSYTFENSDSKYLPEERKKLVLNGKAYSVAAGIAKHSAIFLNNYNGETLGSEDTSILLRFTRVFDQAYIRFLDLKKAEAQAKESQIQLALERVRARTMAMHKSDELADVATLLFKQVSELGIKTWTTGFNIWSDDNDFYTDYITNPQGGFIDPYTIDVSKGSVFRKMSDAKKSGEDFFVNFEEGEELEETYRQLTRAGEKQFKELVDNGFAFPTKQYEHVVFGAKVSLLFITYEPVPEAHEIFKRFGKVFEQAYTRFLDLQKAEAQGREAQIEAALEKVRSRTLAMQKSDELSETAAEVFKQLIGLGIEPNRLYIGVVHGDSKDMEMWATDEDGTRVGKKFTFNAADNASVKKLYEGWVSKIRSVIVDMQGKELEEYISYLKQLGIPLSHALSQKRRVQSVAYFDKGFIGMASPDEPRAETMQLLERFAAVFNLTFTRFNDLKVAEAHALQAEQDLIAIKEAKQKAEDALAELQATQKQLIQTEKMASLGELTAGIAHEIQNPLNFVNNFSDVSNELIEEMEEELATGNTKQAIEIANDLKENLEKILHHGRRADAIVKGMLQHSRSSSGVKEPTDINSLADEYLRLAFHGYRAKDKSFNAKFETNFDNSIEKINLIPQDIGRVILNLINNAFYTVNEKRKQVANGYEPTVTVTTKKVDDRVEISVKDNGNGIPKKMLDKIFQPFFTTKPTGQGTGLGLSLSYDIITKGHDGEIDVKTSEGNGAEFIVSLPIN